MRKPTGESDSMYWHREAMAGNEPPITDEPQCGYFIRQLVKNGPWMPAYIMLHQITDFTTGELREPEVLRCFVGAEQRNAHDEWLWLCQNPISREEFVRRSARMPPEPYKPFDFNIIKPEF